MSLSFSSSGIVTGKKRAFMRQLRPALIGQFPDTFEFVGDTFRHRPHPLLWVMSEDRPDVTSEHLHLWGDLNECVQKKVRPAILKGRVPFAEGFGIDCTIRVIPFCSDKEKSEITIVQNGLVQSRIVAQHIDPPHYVMLRHDPVTIIDDVILAFPGLKNLRREVIEEFARKQITAIDDYIKKIDGQNDIIWIESQSMDEMIREALSKIGIVLNRARIAVA